MNLRAILFCGALSAASLPAADTLTEQFQRALFEEEANRNLPAAIAGYEEVVKRLDEQRQLAATAVFRMGESYRKLGKTNEAVAAYERIIREFADQETLVKLSGQNLSVLRPARTVPTTAAAAASGSPTAADLTELRRLEILLETVRSLEPMSDAELRTLFEFANDHEAAKGLKGWRSLQSDLERHRSDLRNRPEDKTVAERVQFHERLVQDGEAWWSEWRAATLRMLEARVEAARRLAGREWSEGQSSSASRLDPSARARQKELLEQEITLVEQTLKEDQLRLESGNLSREEAVSHQRELLQLRRKVAALEDTAQAISQQKQLINEELELVAQLMATTEAQINIGRASRAELRPIQREQLQLQRELADLDRPRSVSSTTEATAPAMTAEEAEELRRVQALVANSPDLINAPGTDSLCPLRLAIRNGHVQVFRYLLDHGADVNNQRGSGSSPMHTAAAAGQLVILDELLARSANPSLLDGEGNTPLHRAARLGFVTVAERLLKAGVDIDALRGARSLADEQTPLQLAMAANQVAMVQLLITNRANVSLQSSQLNPPLFLALARVPQFIDTLLEAGANPNGTNTSGTSVLYRAVERAGSVASQRRGEPMEQGMTSAVLDAEWVDITRKLLDKGALVNVGTTPSAQMPQAVSPLFPAVGSGIVELVALLLERGADPNLARAYGPAALGNVATSQTALHYAVTPGGLPMVELLLKHKADPNAKSQAGDTALIKALVSRQVEIAEALLSAGADPNLTDAVGQSSLAIACGRLDGFSDPALPDKQNISVLPSRVGMRTVDSNRARYNPRQLPEEQIEDWFALIRLLRVHGAMLDVPMSTDDTTRPLHRAAGSRLDLLKLLLEAKASVAVTNRFGHTPLFSAAGANRPEAIRLLIAAGADINVADVRGNTPLHLAIMRDNLEAARVLLELGADKSATNKDGLSPARFADRFPAPGTPTAFDGVLPDYDQSAVTAGRPVDLNMNAKRRVAELFKGE